MGFLVGWKKTYLQVLYHGGNRPWTAMDFFPPKSLTSDPTEAAQVA